MAVVIHEAHRALHPGRITALREIGITLAMPVKKIDGLSSTSTSDSRASNCSLRLRVNLGQCWAPGMMGASAAIIWQPLHTPSAKVSPRWKKAANASASAGLNITDRAQPSPAPSVSP
jgi:hypothetical protein